MADWGFDSLVRHGRGTTSFNGADEVGMSLILRMHKHVVDGHLIHASYADTVAISNGGVTRVEENVVHVGINWQRPASSRLLVGRTMSGRISRVDQSIAACIVANRHYENELILQLCDPSSTTFNPGDVFKNNYSLCVLGFESNDAAGAVKGSKAAGGAVNAWCTPNPKFVLVEEAPSAIGNCVTTYSLTTTCAFTMY
jgi:hypothetical protein